MKNIVTCKGIMGSYRLTPYSSADSLYGVSGDDRRMAKLFSASEQSDDLTGKLTAMLEMKVSPCLNQVVTLAWPDELLYDRGRVVGYLMPRNGESIPLMQLFAGGDVKAHFGSFDFRSRVVIALNLATAVATLHAAGVTLCRFDPSCIFLDKKGKVMLTGLEHCAFTHKNIYYPEPYRENACCPPEGRYSEAGDCFSLAVLLFRILYGVHPFFPGGAVSENIRTGNCPFLRDPHDARLTAYLPFHALPACLTDLFRRCFDYDEATADSSAFVRPSAKQYVQALMQLYLDGFRDCYRNPDHVYPAFLASCPWCALGSRRVNVKHFGK